MIHFTRPELNAAFRRHLQVYRSEGTVPAGAASGPSYKLLLAYAVECGFKAVILKDEGLYSGDELLADPALKWVVIGATGHEIARLAYRAGYSPCTVSPLFCVPLLKPAGANLARSAGSGEVHLVWRYGATTNASSEAAVVRQLEAMATWLEGELT